MTALLCLLAAAWLASHSRSHPWAAAGALVAAALAGTTLPDLDLTLGLGHRSGLTHSVLPALACALRRQWRSVAAGLALGLGLHLSADLFPNAMRGYATIKLPGEGSIGTTASYWWIAANAALAFAGGAWVAARSVPAKLTGWSFAAVALLGATYLFATDGGWWALALFATLGWAAAWLSARLRRARR